MDTVLNIKNKFMTGLVSKILGVVMKKALGCDVRITLDELRVATQGNEVQVKLNASMFMEQEDFKKSVLKLVQ